MSRAPTSSVRVLPHAVYRVFTQDGQLLYVGCSLSPLTRITSHCHHKPWRKLIASVSVEWFENWDAAFEAETAAIRDESPIWNVHKKLGERIQAIGIYHRDYREDDPSTWIVRVTA